MVNIDYTSKDPTRGISSRAYVQMSLTPLDDEDLVEADLQVKPTLIRMPDNCDHVRTICTECADEWVEDGFRILFSRTIGGRRLLARLRAREEGWQS